jgi:hypothetical protein
VPDRGGGAGIVAAGRVVLLNGPSSAGKTSIAAALTDALPTPWLNVPADLLSSRWPIWCGTRRRTPPSTVCGRACRRSAETAFDRLRAGR